MSRDDLTVRQLWHDRGERRGYPVFSSFWRTDGRGVLFVGDLDERYRLYSMSLDDEAPTRLTAGEWDVAGSRGRGTVALVPQTREIFFVSNQKSPYERHVYRMPEGGGAVTQVTSLPGVHTPFVSPDGSKVAVLHSNDVTPTELYIVDAKGGAAEQRITRSPPDEFYDYEWAEPRYVTFESRIDDFTLHGRILEPPGLDESQKYPVVLGPVYSNTVRNEWRGLYGTLQQFMALEGGYINLQVDIRGSVGYGKTFREIFQGDWGGGDIEDLHSGVEYLETLALCGFGSNRHLGKQLRRHPDGVLIVREAGSLPGGRGRCPRRRRCPLYSLRYAPVASPEYPSGDLQQSFGAQLR